MLMTTLGSYQVQVAVWESHGAMLAALENCDLGSLYIRNQEYEDCFYSLCISSIEGVFGIGLTTYDIGLKPCILYDKKGLNLIIGHNSAVNFIDIQTRKITSTIDLVFPFYQFYTLDHFDKGAFFLIQSEFEVLAYTYQGACVWTHRGKDIISGFQLTSSALQLDYMDGARCTLDWVDGRQLL